ncbi:MAG: hypothetical protein ACLTCQ_08460, partial [Enterocloster bolteae]
SCHGNQQQERRTSMVSILFFIIVILIISILCFLSGRRMAENRAEKTKIRKIRQREAGRPNP